MARMTKEERAERKTAIAASVARIKAEQERVCAVVAKGVCPTCGAGLTYNSSIKGWWQCEQFGNEVFRKDPSKPACSWQGFTC